MRVGTSYKRASLDGPYDAIVVGSGMGSLSTAAILARRARKRVLVLERHHEVGGFTHVFRRKGYAWDVGFHYLGQVNRPEHEFARGFDYVTEGRLRWQPMPDVYERIRIADRTYDFPTGVERLREKLKGYFPSEATAIDRYLDAVFDCTSGRYLYFLTRAAPRFVDLLFGYFLKRRFLRYADRTTASVLGELTRDPELIAVLTGQWADYGLPPGQSSFASHAILVHHFFEGGAYPVGGSAQMAAALAPTIEAAGGAICVGAEVEQILLDARSRAVGVRMKDGRELRAPIVISGVGAPITYGSLLPAEHPRRRSLADAVATVPPSISHLGLYLGVKRAPGEPELDGANLWVYPHADHDRSMAEFEADLDAPFPVLFLSFPSAKDPQFAEEMPGHSTVSAVVPVAFRAFERWSDTRWKKRGDDYEAFKEKLTQRLITEVRRQVPALRGDIEVAELSTPLSTQHFANYAHGEIYGMAPVPGRFRVPGLAAQTPFAGLYLTGQDVSIAGVAGALLSGVLTASAVLGKNLVPEVFGATVFR